MQYSFRSVFSSIMLLSASTFSLASPTTSTPQSDPNKPNVNQPTYGAMLEGFTYPHAIQRFNFASQQQDLSMGYMDIKPVGKSLNKTAVLLHGKNFCGATWEYTIRTLSEAGYRVIVPDQIGFCSSTKPAHYQFSLNQLAENTHQLLQSLKIEKATLIGHSMGGMLAARYALNYPTATERLIMVNPIGLEDWQAEGVPYATIDQLYQGELKTTYDSIKNYQLKFYYNGVWKPEYDQWVNMLNGMYQGEAKHPVAWNQAQTSDMIFNQPVVHQFAKIAVPTTLMIGMLDRTAPGANRASPEIAKKLGNYPLLSQKVSQQIPNAQLVSFADLGHSPQVEAPEIFHQKLLAVLKK